MLLLVFLLSTCGSWLLVWGLIRTQSWHAAYSMDRAATGPQKFHHLPTPRVGGVAVMAGLLMAFASMTVFRLPGAMDLLALIVAGIPVFL
ncbi:MAG: glycosyl transferase, partial [Pseudogulbenkiania sp.]|nr:glycosyl transferase [Pseudogulbenkiania sp.]